jgi:hypothetical protein
MVGPVDGMGTIRAGMGRDRHVGKQHSDLRTCNNNHNHRGYFFLIR